MKSIVLGLSLVSLIGCAAPEPRVVDVSEAAAAFRSPEVLEADGVAPGVDTTDTIRDRFGRPTGRAILDASHTCKERWIYSRHEAAPSTEKRVLLVDFDVRGVACRSVYTKH